MEDIVKTYSSWTQSLEKGDEAVKAWKGNSKYQKDLKQPLGALILSLRYLLTARGVRDHVLCNLEVDAKQRTAIQRALRVLLQMQRAPTKPLIWWLKNRHHLKVIEDTQNLPTRVENSHRFTMRGFDVIDTIDAGTTELDNLRHQIEEVYFALRETGKESLLSLCYGPLLFVGKLEKPKTLAWYDGVQDVLRLRAHVEQHSKITHILSHELGHRLWQRVLGPSARLDWKYRHRYVQSLKSPVPLPQVGESLGLKVRGYSQMPIVTKVEVRAGGFNRYYFNSSTGYIQQRDLEKKGSIKNFPTPYSATNEEEHFCEAFAMYICQTLPPEHRAAFEEIIVSRLN